MAGMHRDGVSRAAGEWPLSTVSAALSIRSRKHTMVRRFCIWLNPLPNEPGRSGRIVPPVSAYDTDKALFKASKVMAAQNTYVYIQFCMRQCEDCTELGAYTSLS
eukprot:6021478-Pleurochrysis_carterae.AAC.2